MVNRILLFTTCVLLSCTIYAQTFYDAEDGSAIFSLYRDARKEPRIKYYGWGDSIKIDFDIRPKEGIESLNSFLDSLYYAHFTERTYREVNLHEFYTILFDDKLCIRDVRIIHPPRKLFDYEKAYFRLAKKILSGTGGKWIKQVPNGHWGFYTGCFHMK